MVYFYKSGRCLNLYELYAPFLLMQNSAKSIIFCEVYFEPKYDQVLTLRPIRELDFQNIV